MSINEYWKGRTVLITGGCGFLGSHLARHLVTKGSVVRVADNLSTGSLSRINDILPYIEFINVDLSNFASAFSACQNIEIVFDLAASVSGIGGGYINERQAYFDTINPALMVLNAASFNGVSKFIYFSSACVYSADCVCPISENDCIMGSLSTLNRGYSLAKRVAESWVSNYRAYSNMQTTILRPFNICGPGASFDRRKSHVIPALIRKAHESDRFLEVNGSGNQKRSFIDVRDIANISARIAQIEPGIDLVNVASDQSLAISEIATIILMAVRKNLAIKYKLNRPTGPSERTANITRLMNILGAFNFRNIKESIYDIASEY